MTAFALMIMCAAIVAFFLDEIIAGLKKTMDLPGGQWAVPMGFFSIVSVTFSAKLGFVLQGLRSLIDEKLIFWAQNAWVKIVFFEWIIFIILSLIPILIAYFFIERRSLQQCLMTLKKVYLFSWCGIFVFLFF